MSAAAENVEAAHGAAMLIAQVLEGLAETAGEYAELAMLSYLIRIALDEASCWMAVFWPIGGWHPHPRAFWIKG